AIAKSCGVSTDGAGYADLHGDDRLLPVQRGASRQRARHRSGTGGASGLRSRLDLRSLPPMARRAGPQPVRLVCARRHRAETVDHDGEHYVVENARIYTLPSAPPPILVSGFGEQSVRLAAKIGDGFITTSPNSEHIDLYRRSGGKGPAQGGVKVCWHEDKSQ